MFESHFLHLECLWYLSGMLAANFLIDALFVLVCNSSQFAPIFLSQNSYHFVGAKNQDYGFFYLYFFNFYEFGNNTKCALLFCAIFTINNTKYVSDYSILSKGLLIFLMLFSLMWV